MKSILSKLTLLGMTALTLLSCAHDYKLVGTEREQGREPIWMATHVTVGTTRAFDNTTADHDSKIFTIRLIISDSQTGQIVYNEKTVTPVAVQQRYSQQEGVNSQWKKPFKLIPGKYDFWFIANEGQDWYAPNASTQAQRTANFQLGNQALDRLAVGTHISGIFGSEVAGSPMAPLSHLDLATYKTGGGRDVVWWPSETRPMPMSAVYRNITVTSTRNGKGQSQSDPQHFVADGDEVVKLVRAFAKVTVHLERAAEIRQFGDGIFPRGLSYPVLGDFGVVLLNRPRYWSYFNSPLFKTNHAPREYKFYSDIFPEGESRYRYERIARGEWFYSQYPYQHMVKSPDVNYTTADVSANPDDRRTYTYTFYVPEMLLEKGVTDGGPKGGVAERWDRSLLISLTPKNSELSKDNRWVEPPLTGDAWPLGSQSAFKSGLEETKYFSVGQMNLNDPTQSLAQNGYLLPNADQYSKFSLLRNTHYVYTVREADRLQVDVRILPWEEAENQGERYVYSEFMIWVQDPTFSSSNKENRVTIQTTVPNHRFKRVKLTLLDQNGAPNQRAFFRYTDGMENGGTNSNWIAFGNQPNMLNAFGHATAIINWVNTSGSSAPAAGKAFIKVEYFSDEAMTQKLPTPRDGVDEVIEVRASNWHDIYQP